MKKDWKNFLDSRFWKGIAHRGLHDEARTENGLEAFRNAIAHDKAFEFDIHLTKDGQLVVVHDSDLKRVTGKEGTVEEKTLAELKRDYRLLDGEEIPTLEELGQPFKAGSTRGRPSSYLSTRGPSFSSVARAGSIFRFSSALRRSGRWG